MLRLSKYWCIQSFWPQLVPTNDSHKTTKTTSLYPLQWAFTWSPAKFYVLWHVSKFKHKCLQYKIILITAPLLDAVIHFQALHYLFIYLFWVASCEVRNLQLRHFRLWDIGFKTLRRRPRSINITVQLRLPFDQFLFFCCLLKNKNDDESFSTVNRSVHRFDRLYNHNNISALVSFILQLSQSCSAIRIKHFWEEKRNMLVLKIHSAQTHSSKFTKGYGWKIYGEITRLSERIGNVSKSYSIFF